MRAVEKKEFADLARHIQWIIDNADQFSEIQRVAKCSKNHIERLQSRFDQTHMNYSNQETAFADIFINNNQWMLDHVKITIASIQALEITEEGWTREQHNRFHLADYLKEYFEELKAQVIDWSTSNPSALSNQSDNTRKRRIDIVLGLNDIGSLWRVEWSEVAQSQLEE